MNSMPKYAIWSRQKDAQMTYYICSDNEVCFFLGCTDHVAMFVACYICEWCWTASQLTLQGIWLQIQHNGGSMSRLYSFNTHTVLVERKLTHQTQYILWQYVIRDITYIFYQKKLKCFISV